MRKCPFAPVTPPPQKKKALEKNRKKEVENFNAWFRWGCLSTKSTPSPPPPAPSPPPNPPLVWLHENCVFQIPTNFIFGIGALGTRLHRCGEATKHRWRDSSSLQIHGNRQNWIGAPHWPTFFMTPKYGGWISSWITNFPIHNLSISICLHVSLHTAYTLKWVLRAGLPATCDKSWG